MELKYEPEEHGICKSKNLVSESFISSSVSK